MITNTYISKSVNDFVIYYEDMPFKLQTKSNIPDHKMYDRVEVILKWLWKYFLKYMVIYLNSWDTAGKESNQSDE